MQQVGKILGLYLAGVAVLAGCQSAGGGAKPADAPELPQVSRAQVATVMDTIASGGVSHTQADGLIAAYKDAFDNTDGAKLDGMLSADFRFVRLQDLQNASIQDRAMFMGRRAGWTRTPNPDRGFEAAIKNVEEQDGALLVSAFVTRGTKHFSPRSIDIFTFRQTGGEWELAEIKSAPLYPIDPGLLDAQIYIGDFIEDYAAVFEAGRAAGNPDAAIDAIDTEGGFSKYRNQLRYSVVAVFKEPPPPGSTVELIWKMTRNRVHRFSTGKIEITAPPPYYVVAGYGDMDRGRKVAAELRVDGVTIAEAETAVKTKR